MSIPVRHSGRIAFAALIVITLIAALLGVRLFALAQAPGGAIDTTIEPSFTIGPIEGLTTTWHWAPPATSIPLETVARLFQPAPPDATVIWTGADEVARDDQGSTAEWLAAESGPHVVHVELIPPAGEGRSSQALFNVVDIGVEQITVSPIDISVDPVKIDEDLPQDEINELTMGYFFGPSIAALRDLGDGQYRTSVNRKVHMNVEVDPPGFAPLVEEASAQDCNGNGIPDEFEPDCNGNGVPDDCDIADGTSQDCNGNGFPDDCEADCNGNGVPDDCDIADGTSQDCNGNGTPDDCEADCNGNGVPDDCDIADGTSQDCNGNGIPDDCEPVEEPDVRTQGFWNQVCSGPHPSGEHENLPDYVDFVGGSVTFADVDNVASLCERLTPNPTNDKCEQAEAQFMALLLNLASGRVAECNCTDDPDVGPATVGEVIVFIDDLLSNPDRTIEDCVLAQSIADLINNGLTLVDCP